MANTSLNLRGLVFSAAEVREAFQNISDAGVEDYLNIFNNLVFLSDELDTKQNGLRNSLFVNSTPFIITDEDELFCFPNTANIDLNLPSGEGGRNLRIHNIGTNSFNVNIIPNGTDLLFGINSPEVLYDQEVIIITYNEIYGWD